MATLLRIATPRYASAACASARLQRGFVSATLLSRSDFENRTVAQLKEELKARGLSTAGKNRTALLKRLLADETARANAPLPPNPAPSAAAMSTSVLRQANGAAAAAAAEEGSKGLPNLMPSLLNEGFGRAQTWPASVSLPGVEEEAEPATNIPFVPDNFDSHLSSHDAPSEGFTPELSTAAHPETLPGGGPALSIDLNDEEAEPMSPKAAEAAPAAGEGSRSFWSDVLHNAGMESLAGANVKGKGRAQGVVSALVEQIGLKPDAFVFSPTSPRGSAEGRFKFQDRPLDQKERQGLFVLAGLLLGGWGLAGIFAPTSAEKKAKAASMATNAGAGAG